MRCSVRHFKTSHPADVSSESTSAASSVGISNLFPELLTIIFSYLEVRDKGCAAQVSEFTIHMRFICSKICPKTVVQKYTNAHYT